MVVMCCGGGGDPEGSFYRAQARPELRSAQEGPRGTAEQFGGFAARERKEKAVPGAERIEGLNARVNQGDAAGFGHVWKLFEFGQWQTRARKRKAARGRRKEEDDAVAFDF